jgi:hypothetical protein
VLKGSEVKGNKIDKGKAMEVRKGVLKRIVCGGDQISELI